MEPIITYEMMIDDELTDGVFAMSLVDSPAIKSDYVLLSDDKGKIEIKLEKIADNKRHIVSGAALIPGIIIPRNGPDGPYNITFSEETIRKISENFLIQNKKDNVTLQHQISVNNVFLVESWIVEDPKNDKSTTLGLDVPKGTWCISMKIKDDNLWQEFIESGQLRGFSLEGNFAQKEVHMHDEYCHLHLSDEEKEILNLMDVMLYSQADVDARYVWRLSESDENCPSCVKLNGKVKTLREWAKVALPRMKNNTTITTGLVYESPYSAKSGFNCYGTFCEANCKCQLVKVSDATKTKGKPVIKYT